MRVRRNLAGALLIEPDILFTDEPTSGLDAVNTAMVREHLLARKDQGRTVVSTAHDMDTATAVCDRVAFIVDGRIAACDTPRAFRLAYARPELQVGYHTDDGLTSTGFPAARALLTTEFVLQRRHGVMVATALMTSLWGAVLTVLPTHVRAASVPWCAVGGSGDPRVLLHAGVGGIERSNGATAALGVEFAAALRRAHQKVASDSLVRIRAGRFRTSAVLLHLDHGRWS